ncbi:MAG: UDP-N-acetylmuramoyl-L-alanyl-D-glutamate--2,6-diaminopimelate ligase [Gammaproteobacteria bacterium]|nr:UDP-N-acetylmuramoyl-L-alanyl-D-glutamate--2,6-diaminopimelate ligase [Gammaproteobacteria bacterium]
MRNLSLNEVMKDLSHYEVSGLSLDSRLVKPGDLFFAYPGEESDGRMFIEDAIKRGAEAILAESDDLGKFSNIKSSANLPILFVKNLQKQVSKIAARFYNNPGKALKIIGVTGTNGKTSCTYFLGDILKQLGSRCAIMGTLGNGLYGALQPTSLTTPDAITIQKVLSECHTKEAEFVAMEVSSHSLKQGRVNAVPFTVGIFTNLTQDHLDYHGSMQSYGNAKKKLFTELSPLNSVINADDDFGYQLIQELSSHKKVYAYSIHRRFKSNDFLEIIQIDEVQLNHTGIHANVFTPWGKGEFHTQLIGEFNLSNVLAVITTLCLLDIPLPNVLNSISHLKPVPGRMQTLGGQDKPLVVIDYAHSPDALEKVLSALRSHCRGKLYCVFGCGGDRDRGKRPLMAKIVESLADYIIVTDDNPRTENPADIVKEIIQGFSDPNAIIIEHDRAKAINNAIHHAEPGDCVLIAGKGAELYQQIGIQKIPFSDIDEVKKSLAIL